MRKKVSPLLPLGYLSGCESAAYAKPAIMEGFVSVMKTDFYDTLSPLEQAYWHRLSEVFALVNPQQPEKGLITIIQRARDEAKNTEEALEHVLERHYQGAKERTKRRVYRLNQCSQI